MVYKGYFGDKIVMKQFVDACVVPAVTKTLENEPSTVLSVGSDTGDLELGVYHRLLSAGMSTRLILSDVLPPDTLSSPDVSAGAERLCVHNTQLPFADESVELVLARSVTHYE